MATEFNQEQFDSIYPNGIENHYWNRARNILLKNILKKTGAVKNILEVGCGKGIVTEYLLNNGFGINGIELAEVPINDNLKNYVKSGMNVFELCDEESRYIETVLLLDVIEHLENPETFITGLVDKFPRLKRFIITVPACNELFSNYDEFNGHYRRYDKEMLLNEFKNIKFTKIEVSYFFHLLYLPAKILLNTKGNRSLVIKAPESFIQKLLHKILAVFFYIEYFLFPSTLKGTSLVIIVELA